MTGHTASTGQRIKVERVRQGLTQDDLVRQAGVSVSTLQSIERDRHVRPKSLRLVTEALGLNIAALDAAPDHAPPTDVGLDLAAVEARTAAATRGPWLAASDNGRKTGIAVVGTAAARGTGQAIAVFAGTGGRRHQDAAFTAHAREDVPALLAEVRRLRERLATVYGDVAGRLGAAGTWDDVRDVQSWLARQAAE